MIVLLLTVLLEVSCANANLLVYASTEQHENLKFPSHNVQPTAPPCSNDTYIMETVLNLDVYNKHKLPDPLGVDVKVEYWVQEISAVSESTSDFELDIYVSEIWVDPALKYDYLNPCKKNLSFSGQVLSRLWTPNNCFIDSKEAKIHESPFRNEFLMIYPNGTICKFPMDTQSCFLTYESFSYNTDEVRLSWMPIDKPVSELKKIQLPDYDLISISTEKIDQDFPAGKWIDLKVTFVFERRYVWYFLQAYLPTYLTIFISWISFALGSKAMPARTMLGVNSLLAMIFQFGNIMRNLPRVSYVKAIDVWMLACMTFVFGSMLELAAVGYLAREISPIPQRRSASRSVDRVAKPTANSYVYVEEYNDSKRCCAVVQKSFNSCWTADNIDKVSSICFPLFFSLFNIAYWSYYLT